MQETWKQFRNTRYSVSNKGNVLNYETGQLLKLQKTRQGYFRVTIWEDSKSFTIAVHRIVAEAFLGLEEGLPIVNHKDGDPSNNCIENLEWCSISDNVKHAYETGLSKRGQDCKVAKLTEADVLKILELVSGGNTIAKTAKEFGISAAAVSHIWNNETWKHIKREKPETKNYKGKLKASDIPIIRELFKTLDDNQIAAKYGVHRASIYNIRKGKNWSNY